MPSSHQLINLHIGDTLTRENPVVPSQGFVGVQVINGPPAPHRRVIATFYGDNRAEAADLATRFICWAESGGLT